MHALQLHAHACMYVLHMTSFIHHTLYTTEQTVSDVNALIQHTPYIIQQILSDTDALIHHAPYTS